MFHMYTCIQPITYLCLASPLYPGGYDASGAGLSSKTTSGTHTHMYSLIYLYLMYKQNYIYWCTVAHPCGTNLQLAAEACEFSPVMWRSVGYSYTLISLF